MMCVQQHKNMKVAESKVFYTHTHTHTHTHTFKLC